MKALKILGIYRHPRFSNNAIEADRLILEESLNQLRATNAQKLQIELIEEAEVPETRGDYALVLTMAQDHQSLQALDRNFSASPQWNSTLAIRNCYRKTMSETLRSLPVNYAPFQILRTAEAFPTVDIEGSYWLKRSDFHAISDEDVALAEGPGEIQNTLKKFAARGVAEVVLQKHIHGDIYKFYGVKGQFFRPIRVRSFLTQPVNFDFAVLEKCSTVAADALGLTIYGGDAILDSNGQFHLIDVNDWPSFRICREDAAKAIAKLGRAFLEARETGSEAELVSSAGLAL